MPSLCGLPAMKIKQSWDSGKRDFFRTRAETRLSGDFLMIGSRCRLTTNSESILSCARLLFASLPSSVGQPELELKFWTDRSAVAPLQQRPKPYFRSFGPIVFAGFDDFNSLLVDLKRRQVLGRFTRSFAEDAAIWRRVVFPVLSAFLGPAIPMTVLHGACVEHKGRGFLLVGPSGSGKSTLTWHLGKLGFAFLSDDRTYLSSRNGRVFAWSVGGFLKLRRPKAGPSGGDSGGDSAPHTTALEELELDPEFDLGFQRAKCCEPQALVFIERGEVASSVLRPISARDSVARLAHHLNSDTDDAAFQQEIIQGLTQIRSYVLSNEDPPEQISQILRELIEKPESIHERSDVRVTNLISRIGSGSGDPLRRLTRLQYSEEINVMGRFGTLMTNSAAVVASARSLFGVPRPYKSGLPGFCWRIVTEMDGTMSPPWPASAAFSSGALRFVNLGQRSFIAFDLESAEGVAFISAKLAEDAPGFAAVFLATLFHVTAPALGLIPLRAGCVAKENRGLLLLGPPRSGKTTCAYACSKLGLEYHADMATFLELVGDEVRAWGEFWPALFREESHQIFPELEYLALRLKHQSETFLSLDKSLICRQPSRPVTIALATILERAGSGSPRMVRLSRREYLDVLLTSPPYEEVGLFKAHQDEVLAKLSRIPAYKLNYGTDPTEAAMFCRSLLTAQDILKAVP